MERVDAPRRLSGAGLLFPRRRGLFFPARRAASLSIRKKGGENEQTWNKSQERGLSERGRAEEPGKWGCKSGGQTHYKFITDFPRRATLLRIRAKSPTQNLLHTRAVPATRATRGRTENERKTTREGGWERREVGDDVIHQEPLVILVYWEKCYDLRAVWLRATSAENLISRRNCIARASAIGTK